MIRGYGKLRLGIGNKLFCHAHESLQLKVRISCRASYDINYSMSYTRLNLLLRYFEHSNPSTTN